MLQLAWLGLGVVILVAALFAYRSPRALLIGRVALAVLYLVFGAAVNTVFLIRGDDYSNFADGSYIAFVRETWRAVVAPNQMIFIPLLILFEATIGVLLLVGGRWAQLGLVSAIGFHVAVVTFGWWYYLWSIPMLLALVLLLRALRRAGATAKEPSRLVSAA